MHVLVGSEWASWYETVVMPCHDLPTTVGQRTGWPLRSSLVERIYLVHCSSSDDFVYAMDLP